MKTTIESVVATLSHKYDPEKLRAVLDANSKKSLVDAAVALGVDNRETGVAKRLLVENTRTYFHNPNSYEKAKFLFLHSLLEPRDMNRLAYDEARENRALNSWQRQLLDLGKKGGSVDDLKNAAEEALADKIRSGDTGTHIYRDDDECCDVIVSDIFWSVIYDDDPEIVSLSKQQQVQRAATMLYLERGYELEKERPSAERYAQAFRSVGGRQ